MRRTSIDAFNAVVASGAIGKLQKEAYRVLYNEGPLTGQELARQAKIAGLWKRLSELKDSGVIQEVGKRHCTVTGRMALVWDVTQGEPKARVSHKKKLKEAEETIALLRGEIYALKAQLKDGIPTEPDGQTRFA